MIKRLLAVLMVLGMVGGVVGCNTMEGAGEDVERAGEGVQEGAQEGRERLN